MVAKIDILTPSETQGVVSQAGKIISVHPGFLPPEQPSHLFSTNCDRVGKNNGCVKGYRFLVGILKDENIFVYHFRPK